MFDGKAERSVGVVQEGESETRFYRAIEPLVGTAGLMRYTQYALYYKGHREIACLSLVPEIVPYVSLKLGTLLELIVSYKTLCV